MSTCMQGRGAGLPTSVDRAPNEYAYCSATASRAVSRLPVRLPPRGWEGACGKGACGKPFGGRWPDSDAALELPNLDSEALRCLIWTRRSVGVIWHVPVGLPRRPPSTPPSRCALAPSRGELAPTDRVLAHIPPPPSEAYALAGGVEGGDCMRRATPPKYADDTDDAEESSGGLASALLACMPGRPDAGTPSGDGCREGEGCTSDTWPSDTWPCEEASGLSSRRSPARLPCAPAGEPKLRVLGKPLEPALESERRLGAVPSSSGPLSAVPSSSGPMSVADRSTWTEAAAILAPTWKRVEGWDTWTRHHRHQQARGH